MGKARIKLLCMNGRGESPGEETVHYLPDHVGTTDTYIVLHESEGFRLTDNIDECNSEEFESLAKLTKHSSTFSIVLEPLVDRIFIEPAYSPTFAGLFDTNRISVPESTATTKHYIHLRPDDTINFSEDGLKIAVMAEIPDSSLQPSSDANIDVQVKSSNVDDDDANDTSDDDLDQSVTIHAAKPLVERDATPARSEEHAVMETPQTTTLTNLPRPNEESAPYSTAQEAPTSETVLLNEVGMGSPTEQVQNNRTARDETLTGSPLVDSIKPTNDIDTPDVSPKPLKTYGRQHGRRVALRLTSELLVEDTNLTGPEQNSSQTVQRAPSNEASGSPDPAATSEPLEPSGIAYMAASGSIGSRSAKRKVTEIEDDEEDEDSSPNSSKKPKVMEEQYDDDEEMSDAVRDGASKDGKESPSIDGISIERSEPQSDAEDAVQEDVKPASKAKKGRPANSTRRKTKGTSSTEPLNSSPAVVVAVQRSSKKRAPTSMSPPSSATSSVLTGKVPSILLSNESPCRKGATATFLKKQGATIIDDVKTRRSHFVCVLNGDKLTTTAKVLRSLALGKLVVTEDWVMESKKAGKFLDPDDFVHDELKETIYSDRRAIFQNTNLFFTQTLASGYEKGWKDIQELAKEAGASHVEQGSSGDFGTFKEGRMDVICFGQAKNDPDVLRLKKSHGVKVYHKNLLTESIRKGELDLDMEEHVL